MSFAIFEKWSLNILQTETGSLTTLPSSRMQMFRLLAEPLLRNGLMVAEILGLRPTRTFFEEIAPNDGSLKISHFVSLDSEIIPVLCS